MSDDLVKRLQAGAAHFEEQGDVGLPMLLREAAAELAKAREERDTAITREYHAANAVEMLRQDIERLTQERDEARTIADKALFSSRASAAFLKAEATELAKARQALEWAAETLRSHDAGDPSTATGWASDELLEAWLKCRAALAKPEETP